MRTGTTLLLVLGFLLGPQVVVLAQGPSSASFTLPHTTLDESGGTASSTDFVLKGAQGQIGIGESQSTHFSLQSGIMYWEDFEVSQGNWRWYDDEEHTTPSNPLSEENIAPAGSATLDVHKLRLTLYSDTYIGNKQTKIGLEYSEYSDFSAGVVRVGEIASCATQAWCYADGAGDNDQEIAVTVLSDSVLGGAHNESGLPSDGTQHVGGGAHEYEFTLLANNVLEGTTYFFRPILVHALGASVPVAPEKTRPSIVAGGGTLTFSIEGLPQGGLVEGIVTDVTTTGSSVPFGLFDIYTSVEAAQRVNVRTNASQGYQVFLYERQGLLGPTDVIDPVTATNAVPASWTSACDTSGGGCYGYHTGDDILEGGSTRFAADDTYAALSTTPAEVAFSDGAGNDSFDIVYRVEVGTEQAPETYESEIVYIVVPTF